MTPDPLASFAEARLDEVETADWHVMHCSGMPWPDGHCCDAQRWLARDVAAKRAILAEHWAHSEPEFWIDGPKAGQPTGRTACWCSTCDQDRDYGYISGPQEGCATLRHLAAIDASHPDYLSEWAPRAASPAAP